MQYCKIAPGRGIVIDQISRPRATPDIDHRFDYALLHLGLICHPHKMSRLVLMKVQCIVDQIVGSKSHRVPRTWITVRTPLTKKITIFTKARDVKAMLWQCGQQWLVPELAGNFTEQYGRSLVLFHGSHIRATVQD